MQVEAHLLHLPAALPQYIALLKLSIGRIGLEEFQVKAGGIRKDIHVLSSLIENGFLESRNLLKFGTEMALTAKLPSLQHVKVSLVNCYCYPILVGNAIDKLGSLVESIANLRELEVRSTSSWPSQFAL
jgi:hypothetical protein